MAKKTDERYFINICGKETEVTKKEFEKHFPPVTETEETATTETTE